jgi:hypothetical protein
VVQALVLLLQVHSHLVVAESVLSLPLLLLHVLP